MDTVETANEPIFLKGDEIITHTCDVKKLTLTSKQKESLLKTYKRWWRVIDPYPKYSSFEEYFGCEGEFFLVKVKKEFYKKLEDMMYSRVFLNIFCCFYFPDEDWDYPDEDYDQDISGICDWKETIEEYLERGYDATQITLSRNYKSQIWFVPNDQQHTSEEKHNLFK
jgi:hypothetical protein